MVDDVAGGTVAVFLLKIVPRIPVFFTGAAVAAVVEAVDFP